MNTEVIAVDPAGPDASVIEHAAAVLRHGGLVAFPTETVYGLGAVLTDRRALRRVFEAKGRPATDPLIVHISDAGDAVELVTAWPDAAVELAERFWPGPLTLVVPRSALIPDEVCGGGPSVGVRVPAHPVARAVIAAARVAVAAPSANRFGRVSPTDAAHVIDELDGRIDLVLDGGPTPLGIESTVLDLTGEVPRLLRPGGVTVEDLRSVLGDVEAPERIVVDEATVASGPGQLLSHYAPSTPVVLVEAGATAMDALIAGLAARGTVVAEVVLADEGELAARDLYRNLRAADQPDVDLLVVKARSGAGMGRAVNDRLFRSAQGRVVTDASAATLDRLCRLVGQAT